MRLRNRTAIKHNCNASRDGHPQVFIKLLFLNDDDVSIPTRIFYISWSSLGYFLFIFLQPAFLPTSDKECFSLYFSIIILYFLHWNWLNSNSNFRALHYVTWPQRWGIWGSREAEPRPDGKICQHTFGFEIEARPSGLPYPCQIVRVREKFKSTLRAWTTNILWSGLLLLGCRVDAPLRL